MEDGLEGHTWNIPESITMSGEEKGAGSGIKTKRDRSQI